MYSFTVPVPILALALFFAIPLAIFLILLILAVIPIYMLRVVVSEDEVLASAPPLYSYSVRKSDVEKIMVTSLDEKSDLKPKLRTFGIGLPSYGLGWFKLSNGAKALYWLLMRI
jgi:hypothetical protein